MANQEVKYEIVRHIAVLSTSPKGWTKEVNLVKWNEGQTKLDIRDWAPGREKLGKGVTLTGDETKALYDALAKECARTKAAKTTASSKKKDADDKDTGK